MLKGITFSVGNPVLIGYCNMDYEAMHEAIDGYFEVVYMKSTLNKKLEELLGVPILIICDEEFLYRLSSTKDNVNIVGTLLAGEQLLGNVIVCTEGEDDYGDYDLKGFTPTQANMLLEYIKEVATNIAM